MSSGCECRMAALRFVATTDENGVEGSIIPERYVAASFIRVIGVIGGSVCGLRRWKLWGLQAGRRKKPPISPIHADEADRLRCVA